ncbi:MAG: bis(5'-nucleosyl)-tetraphosphatase (symmetrical) YqeK [Lachnospiraceae bacterium]|nr:bis(5'-nucleosyl)-tetraphosphatase (symmetrical) YqeK [Lachnospiraceae bacterium]
MNYSKKIEETMLAMQKLLPRKRFVHSLGVAYLASSLAMAWGKNSEKAMLAGLLHDCAKYIPGEEALRQCAKYGIPVGKTEARQPYLLHGKLGAWYAEHKYGVDDEKILNAIRFHTTGRPEMCFIEKNIYLSDYLEIGRTQPAVPPLDELRRLAFHDMDLAVYYAAQNTVGFLKEKKNAEKTVEVDGMAFLTLEYYEKLIQERGEDIETTETNAV